PSPRAFPRLSPRHPPLPSFPTRRSSDLAAVSLQLPTRVLPVAGGGEGGPAWVPRAAGGAGEAEGEGGGVGGQPAARPPAAGPRLDRKSTRLNSSHVSISYAVFCLKKKKL